MSLFYHLTELYCVGIDYEVVLFDVGVLEHCAVCQGFLGFLPSLERVDVVNQNVATHVILLQTNFGVFNGQVLDDV